MKYPMYSLFLAAAVFGATHTSCSESTPAGSAETVAAAKDGFEITGQLRNAPAGTKVYLSELTETQFVSRDTAATDAQGRFKFKGSVTETGLYQVKVNEANQVLLALDNKTKVQLTGDAQKLGTDYTVKGSKDSEMLQQVTRTMNQSRKSLESLNARFQANGQAGREDSMKIIEQQFYKAQAYSTASLKKLMLQNPKSVVSAFVMTNLVNPDENFGFADSLATGLKASIPNSRYTKALVAKLEPLRKTAVGTVAPDINLATPDGKTVSLSSLRGQYVLLDFWASWCGPCRQENPNVVRTFNKYKDKNFTVYGVSLDQDKGKWEKAIQADGLTWTHVSDLKGWQSAAGQAYGVTGIPMNFLLDPQGKIIAKNLRGEQLEARLAKVLK
ncbi:TlpA disulfide reductase family protein [Hymenobacter koreensis]|uniref:TlpA disulfide reductase family protein n=1 Tax=Hymenobacter koreensis TaxID=1084523 RepID=A0ABP8J6V4_9BACT